MTYEHLFLTLEHMFTLDELEVGVRVYAQDFDPSTLDGPAALHAMRQWSKIEKLAAAAKARAAKRVEDTNAFRRDGHRSAAHQLASETGTSVREAERAVDTARKLEQLPAVSDAARNGELSPAQTSAIAKAASADPSAEEKLVDAAKNLSLRELQTECDRVIAAADPNAEAQHERIRKQRSVREFKSEDGAGNIAAKGTPDKIALIMAAVRLEADRLFREANREGRHEPYEAYLFDALVNLTTTQPAADGKRAPRVAYKSITRIDWPALIRGFTLEGEVSEIAGVGPVPVSVIRDIMATGDPFLAAVLTIGKDVVNVAHLGRRATAFQQTAIEWIDPTCTTEGCPNTWLLQIDHREDWHKVKITELVNLDHPCEHCHKLKTRHGWAYVEGRGKRPFVPPSDPRHPKHKQEQAS